jgi:hypothetical protein
MLQGIAGALTASISMLQGMRDALQRRKRCCTAGVLPAQG